MHEADLQSLFSSMDLELSLSLSHENNHDLTKDQKELLLWDHQLGDAGFNWSQILMSKPKPVHGNNEAPAVLPGKRNIAHNHVTP